MLLCCIITMRLHRVKGLCLFQSLLQLASDTEKDAGGWALVSHSRVNSFITPEQFKYSCRLGMWRMKRPHSFLITKISKDNRKIFSQFYNVFLNVHAKLFLCSAKNENIHVVHTHPASHPRWLNSPSYVYQSFIWRTIVQAWQAFTSQARLIYPELLISDSYKPVLVHFGLFTLQMLVCRHGRITF